MALRHGSAKGGGEELPSFRRLGRGALYTGLRHGELLSLLVTDIVDGQVRVCHAKTGKSR
jgi:hypothetical protein